MAPDLLKQSLGMKATTRAALIIALLLLAAGITVLVPLWVRGHERVRVCVVPPRTTCIQNLRMLEGAKWSWAMELHKTTNDTPSMAHITPFLLGFPKGTVPKCPSGGVYTLGRPFENPKCSVKGHDLP